MARPPQIYSAKLKLHPITILTVLYMTEHLVGVQGLIVAVPVAVYIINNVLKIGGPAPEGSEERTEGGLILPQ
jgi:predicted PurR-regulated permease PerM